MKGFDFMKKIYFRLDDACPYMNINNWLRVETLLDKYNVKPLVGIIPDCVDNDLLKYGSDDSFWTKTIGRWKSKNYSFAMHGYQHKFESSCGGINPVNNYSEFAGLPFDVQNDKIKKAVSILNDKKISTNVFFAPAHTFDKNTLIALSKNGFDIISDTIANSSYSECGFTFVPVQSGKVRKLPFKEVTFCYHPNIMTDSDFTDLESFLAKYSKKLYPFPLTKSKRRKSLLDRVFSKMYFSRRKKHCR